MSIRTCLAALALLGVSTVPAAAATITVRIHDVASNEGHVLVALCTEVEFLGSCARHESAAAAPGVVTVTFRDVTPGRYAGMVFHDANDNKTIERTEIGIPIEGAAFSRNAMGEMGPPEFTDAAVAVTDQAAVIDIGLVYY